MDYGAIFSGRDPILFFVLGLAGSISPFHLKLDVLSGLPSLGAIRPIGQWLSVLSIKPNPKSNQPLRI